MQCRVLYIVMLTHAYNIMQMAAYSGHDIILSMLLENGANPNLQVRILSEHESLCANNTVVTVKFSFVLFFVDTVGCQWTQSKPYGSSGRTHVLCGCTGKPQSLSQPY